jgi:hypothetical protein
MRVINTFFYVALAQGQLDAEQLLCDMPNAEQRYGSCAKGLKCTQLSAIFPFGVCKPISKNQQVPCELNSEDSQVSNCDEGYTCIASDESTDSTVGFCQAVEIRKKEGDNCDTAEENFVYGKCSTGLECVKIEDLNVLDIKV